MDIDQGFAPLVDAKVAPKVLVLGTLPGARSLSDQQYYAHPQNAFWWIMSQLLGFSSDAAYSDRVNSLTQAGVMVWDVIASCHRPGSLDSAIRQDTVVANDFVHLFCQQDSIQLIVFNGQASRKLFKKHVEPYQDLTLNNIGVEVMPSTSPAFAAMKRADKLKKWRQLMRFFQ